MQMKTVILIPAFCLLLQFSCNAALSKSAANKPKLPSKRQEVKHIPRTPKSRQQKSKPFIKRSNNTNLNYNAYPPLPNQEAGYVGDFWPRPRKPEPIRK